MKQKWSLEKIDKILKKSFINKKRVIFYKKYAGAITWARRNKKEEKVKKLFDKYCKQSGLREFHPLWTEKQLKFFFKKFTNRSEMFTHPKGISSFLYAKKLNVLKKVSSHFITYEYSTSIGEESTRVFLNKVFKTKFVKIRHPEIINPKTGKFLELDGYCKKMNIAFEYGDHRISFYKKDPSLNLQKDQIKYKRCKELNIKLINVLWKGHINSKTPEKIKEIIFQELVRLEIKIPKNFYKTKFSIVKINKKYKYSKNEILNCVKKCKNRSEFERTYGGMFSCAGHLGILPNILKKFRKKRLKKGFRPNFFWNKETIIEYSKKCKNRTEFYKKYNGAYKKSLALGISDSLVFNKK